MSAHTPTRYGKTCDRCGEAITVAPGEAALCARCRRDETLVREDTRR